MKDCGGNFPEALKKLLGRGFFSFPELLVGLNRDGAFGGFAPLQYLMQALPPSGFLRPLLMAESLAEVERMSGEFVRLTGFRKDCVDYLFSCFAYASGLLGYPPQIPVITVEGKTVDEADEAEEAGSGGCVEESRTAYLRRMPPDWDARWSVEEKCRFLSGLIVVNRENERRIGMKVAVPACVMVEKFCFRLSAELSRQEPGATGALFYAVYDRDGRVADTAALGVMCYDDVSPLPKAVTVPVAPQEVAEILIFWEND